VVSQTSSWRVPNSEVPAIVQLGSLKVRSGDAQCTVGSRLRVEGHEVFALAVDTCEKY
jgi:hypothetical protein